ncbi:MAG TPA: hypothetical protein VHQ65_00435, partial [Thermoanaerobaculia bacterium]|nr:hypothetical protein [Thermoanaerobaculia bacterium]
ARTTAPSAATGSIVPRRILTEEDLDATQPTNQVSSPGAGPRGGYQPPNRRRPQPSVRYVPTPGAVPEAAPPRVDPRAPQTPPPTAGQPEGGRELVPQTGPRFRPGLPSTGRLEMVLEESPSSSRG